MDAGKSSWAWSPSQQEHEPGAADRVPTGATIPHRHTVEFDGADGGVGLQRLADEAGALVRDRVLWRTGGGGGGSSDHWPRQ